MKTKVLLSTAIALIAGGLAFHAGLFENQPPQITVAPGEARSLSARSRTTAEDETESSAKRVHRAGAPASRQAMILSQLSGEGVVERSPSKAATLVESLEKGKDRDLLLDRIARAWAIQSPEAAMEWAQSRQDESERRRLLEAVLEEREKRDGDNVPEIEILADLTAAVQRIGPNGEGESTVQNLTQKWAARNHAAALDWVRQQPAGEVRDHLIVRIAMGRCDILPAEAARMVAEEISSGSIQEEAVISIVHLWGKRDANSAMAWVGQFAEGALKQRAQRELIGIASIQASSGD